MAINHLLRNVGERASLHPHMYHLKDSDAETDVREVYTGLSELLAGDIHVEFSALASSSSSLMFVLHGVYKNITSRPIS